MTYLLLRCLCLAVSVLCVTGKILPLPSYITGCYRNEPNLDECAAKNGQASLPTLVKGDRKYNIPVMDPLAVESLIIGRGNGSVSINLDARNVKILGFKDTQIKSVKIDLPKNTVTLKLFNPKLKIIGNYSVKGRILILPVTGQGYCEFALDNADLVYVLKYNLIKKADGLEYIVPYDNTMTFKPTKGHIRLDNLFNGDKALSDNMNQVMNDNWQVMLEELGPSIGEGIGMVLQQVLGNAVRDIPYDAIFPVKS